MNITFYLFLFIHFIFIAVGFGAVIVIDTFGFLWLRKKVALELVMKVADVTQRLIWIGWSGLVISGIVLLGLMGWHVGARTALKLFFVAMLGMNGIFLHYIKKAFERGEVPMGRMVLATVISQIGWWGAIVIGFLNTNVL